jgi:hypothetical protein
MAIRAAPLSLAGLTVAAIVDVWLVMTLADVATSTPPPVERVEWKPKVSAPGEPIAPAKQMARYQQTLARPLFFKTRAPFVAPPPPPPPIQAARPAPPAPVFVDPGFSVGGIIISGVIRKAYLLKPPERNGAWVREGEEFMGWKLQSISPGIAKLQLNDRMLELRLYAER